jgi:hypothetical protein
MPFTIHLNPGVIVPIQTSVHVFVSVIALFCAYTHSFSVLGKICEGWNRHCPLIKGPLINQMRLIQLINQSDAFDTAD